MQKQAEELIKTSQQLGLGNAVILKMGNKIIGWHR
jgi:hypothetical protein